MVADTLAEASRDYAAGWSRYDSRVVACHRMDAPRPGLLITDAMLFTPEEMAGTRSTRTSSAATASASGPSVYCRWRRRLDVGVDPARLRPRHVRGRRAAAGGAGLRASGTGARRERAARPGAAPRRRPRGRDRAPGNGSDPARRPRPRPLRQRRGAPPPRRRSRTRPGQAPDRDATGRAAAARRAARGGSDGPVQRALLLARARGGPPLHLDAVPIRGRGPTADTCRPRREPARDHAASARHRAVRSCRDRGAAPAARPLPAQARVAELVGQGLAPSDVAETLGLGIATVRTHLKAINAVLGLARQGELVALVTRLSTWTRHGRRDPRGDDPLTLTAPR